MSWSIYAVGSKKGVQKSVQEHQTTADPDQYEPAKALILSEIAKFDDSQGVKLEAAGHCYSGQRSLKIEISPINFVGDPPEEA
jgi:hypothetical protein